jgi:hypothetical protein
MSIASSCRDTAGLLRERFDLAVVADEPLLGRVDGRRLGSATILGGTGAVATVVLVALSVGSAESEMLCAFTPPGSGVPHLALDVIAGPDGWALHLDLLPRVDVATHPAYLRHCMDPLTSAADALLGHPAVEPTELPRRQLALMSRWAITCRVGPAADGLAAETVARYREHWLGLTAGLPAPVQEECADTDLGARDAGFRAALFAVDLDPVWSLLRDLVGAGSAERVRGALAGEADAILAR